MRLAAFTNWHWVVAGIGLGLILMGTVTEYPALRGWGSPPIILAACLWIRKRDTAAEKRYQEFMAEFMTRWAHEPFQTGFRAGQVAEQIKTRR